MNWRLFGWLAALAGGALVAVWLVFQILGFFGTVIAFLLKAVFFVAIVGGLVFLGWKAKDTLTGGDRKQIR
ncbi:hypothetical protein [Haloglycomyces albus]|uniref:hypothetical protein n=1 Tax=Haloglycomyces albus TaxID=526067 RepID=UPI00046CA1F2|nr:hypothetical protein [Haloglycomyces albus]